MVFCNQGAEVEEGGVHIRHGGEVVGQDGVREAVRLDGAGALQMVMAGTQILRHLIRVGAVWEGWKELAVKFSAFPAKSKA